MSILKKTVKWTALGVIAAVSIACSGADARKASYLERGEKYFAEQNYDKARVEVRNALQIDPKYVEARYLAGRVAEKKGEIRDAAGQYQAALDENPKFNQARAALARLYLLGGLTDKGLELVEEGLKDEPNNAALLTVRGAAQAQQGRLVTALEDAEAAAKLVPNDEYTVALLASLYKQSARLDKAIEVVSGGVQHSPKSVDLRIVLADLEAGRQNFTAVEEQLKQVIALEPKVLTHRSRLTQFYLYRKDVDRAESTWREAVAALPDSLEPKLALVDLIWSQRGEEAATREMQGMIGREPDNAQLKLAMGGYLERHNKLDQAEQTYKEVLEEAGKDAQGLSARNRLAALYLKRKDEAHAQTLIGEVLKENPRDNDALILRANMALQKRDAITAITDLRSVLRDQPNSTMLMRALAKAHLQNNEASLAEEMLRNALQADPADVEARKELGQLLLQQNKGDQARTLLEQLASTQGTNGDPEVLDALFKSQLQVKDYQAAQQTAEKVQQLRPKAALGWYYAGLVAEAQQNTAAARKQYETALELQPDVAEPLTALVRMDVAAKDNKRALSRLSEVIARTPKHAVAHNLRGELLIAERQSQAAVEAFEKAVEAAPDWWTPYRGLALAQLSQKQTDAAIAVFQRGIDRTHAGALYTDFAALYERLGKTDEAIKIYEQWLTREPKSLLVANNLTMLLLNYRNDAPSLKRAAQLAETLAASNEPALLDTRGWAKYRSGDFEGALKLLQEAVERTPESAVIRYHVGMAQLRLGNTAGARDNLQAALNSGKSFFGMDEAKTALNQLTQAG